MTKAENDWASKAVQALDHRRWANRLLNSIFRSKSQRTCCKVPAPKPPLESVRGGGGRRHAETCRKREQEGPGSWARGIQRAVNAAFHAATVRRQGDKMERWEESETERQGRGRGGQRAPRWASSPTRRRGRGRSGGLFSTPPHRPGLARREAPAGRRQQWGARRRRGRGPRRLHGGPRPRSGPRGGSLRPQPTKRRGRTRGEGAPRRDRAARPTGAKDARSAAAPARSPRRTPGPRPGRSAAHFGGVGLGPHVPG